MAIDTIQKRKRLLQIVCIFFNTCIGHSEKMDVLMNVEYVQHGYLQAYLMESNYELFQKTFFDNKTHSVRLGYQFLDNGSNVTITSITKERLDYLDSFFYFRCFVNHGNLTILCSRTVQCLNNESNFCSYGFGISWLHDGEYLLANYFENKTTRCVGEHQLTCYRLKDKYTPTTMFNSATSTSLDMVHTETLELTSESMYTVLSTITFTDTTFTSTTYLKDYSTRDLHSDSTANIVGVTVGVVIAFIIVVVVIVICIKRRVKKDVASNGQTADPGFEITGTSFGDSVYGQQKSNSDRGIYSKATSRNVINEDGYSQYNTNTNNYENSISKDDIVNHLSYTISGSDFEDTHKERRSMGLLKFVNTDADTDIDYTTVDHNSKRVTSTSVNEVGNYGNSSNSMDKEENQDTSIDENATVNKNAGYKNLKETKQHKNRAAEHEYNNMQQENTTLKRNEPTKNVYSKLRENIRHFEHPYGYDGAALHAGREHSSTMATDF